MTIAAGNQSQVNTYTTQYGPSQQVTALPNGGWVVTWNTPGPEDEIIGIYQRVYGADGLPLTANEQLVNETIPGQQQQPEIITLTDGGWVITWQTYENNESNIYQRAFSADGTPFPSGEQLVNTITEDYQVSQDVVPLAGGGWVVTWTSFGDADGDGYGIYQQAYDGTGAPAGGQQQINTVTAGNQMVSNVTALSNGGWVVTWNTSNGGVEGTFQQAFQADGTPYAAGEQLVGTTGYTYEVEALADGGWITTVIAPDGSGNGIFFEVYGADGMPLAAGLERLNNFTADEQSSVEIAALPDGGWVAVWNSWQQDGYQSGIYQRVYDADGNPLTGSEILVSTTPGYSQQSARVLVLDDGNWVVTWESQYQDGSGMGIYQKVFDADGTPLTEDRLVNSSTVGDQSLSSITALEDGGWLINWTSSNSGQTDIFQRTFQLGNNAPAGADVVRVTDEDTDYVFSAASFGYADQDGDTLSAVIIKTLPASGSLTLNGIMVTAGQTIGRADLPNLVWTPPLNANGNGVASLTYQVIDSGGTALGGEDTDQTANTLTFDVVSVNDIPTGGDITVAGLEDNTFSFSVSDFTFQDVEGGPAELYVMAPNASGLGLWSYNGVPIANSISLSLDDLDKLTWTPPANVNGNQVLELTFALIDEDGDWTDYHTATINVTPVNDAPTAKDDWITVLEDSPFTFSRSRFGFSDQEGDTLSAVVITTLPVVGTLRLNGQAVTINQQIMAADIGGLVWTPPENGHGGELASLSFKVMDNGGTSNGGQNISQVANTIWFDVLSDNDGPIAGNDAAGMSEGTVKILDVLANDLDGDGDTLHIDTAAVISSNAAVTITNDGKLSITYTGDNLDIGETADISILYFASDGESKSPALARVTVTGVRIDGDPISGTKNGETINGTSSGESISGLGGADLIFGGGGDDILSGGRGSDKLTGGAGKDTFVFSEKAGKDQILDFTRSGPDIDVVDLTQILQIVDFDDLQDHHMRKSGKFDTLIRFDDDSSVLIKGVKMAQFQEENFIF